MDGLFFSVTQRRAAEMEEAQGLGRIGLNGPAE